MWPLTWSAHMILTRDLQTSFWHQVIIDTNIRVITPMSWLYLGSSFVIQLLHLLIIMARVLYCLKTLSGPWAGCFGGLQRRLLQDQRQSWNPMVIAQSKGSALDCYNKKTTGGTTSKVVRKDGWPKAAWPDLLGRQRQLQPWTTILLNE